MSGAVVRRLVRGSVAVSLVLAVAVPPVSAAGTWTDTKLAANTRFDEPSLALDAADRAHVTYVGYGDDPGVYYATNLTGEWVSTRITDATDDAPAIALDGRGGHHIVFVRFGAEAGLHYATDRTGHWVVSRLTTDPAESPSIALDAAGHVHIAFAGGPTAPGIATLDDTTGRWVRTQVTSAPLDGATSIVTMPRGGAKIAFARYAAADPGIYVASATASADGWTLDRLTSAYDDDPSMAVRSGDAVDVAFVRFQPTGRGLYHASGPATWTVTPLSVDSERSFERPSMAIDATGLATIVYAKAANAGDSFGLFETRQQADGSWRPHAPITNEGRADDWPSLALDSRGNAHVAFAELGLGPNPGVYVRDPEAFVLLAASTRDHDVSVTELGEAHPVGSAQLAASDRGPIRSPHDVAVTTPFVASTGDPFVPSVVVVDARPVIVGPAVARPTDVGGGVEASLGLGGFGGRPVLDDAGDRWLAFQRSPDVPMIATNRGDGWQTARGFFAFPGTGAVAVGPGGRIHWVIAGDTLVYQSATSLEGPWSERVLDEHATDPQVAVAPDGSVHIVWRRTSSNEGLYHTTNQAGTWVTTRLTRTSAEGVPALALDATGHVFVAVARAYWAASPGLYLVTNRSGEWVTTRLDGAFDVTDPQLTVDAFGHATVVLGRTQPRPVPTDATDTGPATAPHDHGAQPNP
jgi:hypothetical protein